jgi:diguanylate cyclase (GGDEF)-like protein
LYADLPLAQEYRGYAGMPIRADDGSVFGVLCGLSAEQLPSDLPFDEELLELLAELLSDVLDSARLSDSAQAAERSALVISQTDHLTGLVNRRGWDLAIDQARDSLESYGDHMSVVIVDLDDFKQVNDSAGHSAGDETLREVGQILTALVRRNDVVARTGGDEFGILLVKCAEPEAERRAAYISAAVNGAGVPASTGFATATTADEFNSLILAADKAMYRAKTSRRAAFAD